MTGIELKIAQGQALDVSWYGWRNAAVAKVKSKLPGSSSGSIVLPEAQEKRLYAKADIALADMRKLQKTMVGVSMGVGAGALATVALAGAIMWTRWQAKPDNPGHHPGNPGYPPLTAAQQKLASKYIAEEMHDLKKRDRWESPQQAVAVGISRARRGG